MYYNTIYIVCLLFVFFFSVSRLDYCVWFLLVILVVSAVTTGHVPLYPDETTIIGRHEEDKLGAMESGCTYWMTIRLESAV